MNLVKVDRLTRGGVNFFDPLPKPNGVLPAPLHPSTKK